MVSKLSFYFSQYPFLRGVGMTGSKITMGPTKVKYHSWVSQKVVVRAKQELRALGHPIWVDSTGAGQIDRRKQKGKGYGGNPPWTPVLLHPTCNDTNLNKKSKPGPSSYSDGRVYFVRRAPRSLLRLWCCMWNGQGDPGAKGTFSYPQILPTVWIPLVQ